MLCQSKVKFDDGQYIYVKYTIPECRQENLCFETIQKSLREAIKENISDIYISFKTKEVRFTFDQTELVGLIDEIPKGQSQMDIIANKAYPLLDEMINGAIIVTDTYFNKSIVQDV